MNKNFPIKLANTFGLSMVVLWVICAVFIVVLPGLSMLATKLLLHGLDLSMLGNWNLTWFNGIVGGVIAVVTSWFVGFVVGWSWELLDK